MKRLAPLLALVVGLAVLPTAASGHHELPAGEHLEGSAAGTPLAASQGPDQHSDNMRLVKNWNQGGTYRQGSDLAFWGDTAVLGNYANPGGFRLLDISKPRRPSLIGQFQCPGSQADVSIWKKLVFVSVDATLAGPKCGAGSASQAQVLSGDAWEGLRIVRIANPAQPVQIAAVRTDCGSHTHTIVPDLDRKKPRLLVYILSYPLGGQGAACNAVSHRKISVVSVPLNAPAKARVINTPSVSPAIGCHDVTVDLKTDLAAAACITESQIWDISDRDSPRIIGTIRNPEINIHHSSTFSNDGGTLVLGDELGGAAFSPGCYSGGNLPTGALWFYDMADPTRPALKSSFTIPQNIMDQPPLCTAHNFNTVPLKGKKDILVTAWYNGGTHVLNYTDPANVKEIGFYIPSEGGRADTWSSYWYNGFIYANNFDEDVNSLSATSRGFDVMKIDHPALRGARTLKRLNPQVME